MDEDPQAGGHGLSLQEVVDQYFEHPGQLLHLLRNEKDISIPDAAIQTGVSEDRIRAYEAGSISPPKEDAWALVLCYGASPQILDQVFKFSEG